MSIEAIQVLDAIGLELCTDTVVMSIVDSLDWHNENKHLSMLQDKINTYLAIIETGEVYKIYPEAAGRNIRIDLIFRFGLPESAVSFVNAAAAVAAKLEVALVSRVVE